MAHLDKLKRLAGQISNMAGPHTEEVDGVQFFGRCTYWSTVGGCKLFQEQVVVGLQDSSKLQVEKRGDSTGTEVDSTEGETS